MKLWEKIVEDNKGKLFEMTDEDLCAGWKRFSETGKCDDVLCSMCPFFDDDYYCDISVDDRRVIDKLNENFIS